MPVLFTLSLKTIAEYSEAALTYWKNNRDKIVAGQKITSWRNVELPRLSNENENLGKTLSDEIPLLSNDTLSEEFINCGALSVLEEQGRRDHNCCHHGNIELTSTNYLVELKNILLDSHSDAFSFCQNIRYCINLL